MTATVRKIDFFGGLHGNFLELVINVFIDQLDFDLSRPMFNQNGACHCKDSYEDYRPITKCLDWSYQRIPFDKEDRVIRIVPKKDDMLIAVTNSFLRAGDQSIDLGNLDQNTLEKMSRVPKMQVNIVQIIRDFGTRQHYPRSALRNYFYSMFQDPSNGLDLYRRFDPDTKLYHEFAFAGFFDFSKFVLQLNQVAHFVECEFFPSPELWNLHQEFLKRNQGYHSHIKCQRVLDAIFSGQSMPLALTLVEEAWINHKLAEMIDFYDDDFLSRDQYPADTNEISKLLF